MPTVQLCLDSFRPVCGVLFNLFFPDKNEGSGGMRNLHRNMTGTGVTDVDLILRFCMG